MGPTGQERFLTDIEGLGMAEPVHPDSFGGSGERGSMRHASWLVALMVLGLVGLATKGTEAIKLKKRERYPSNPGQLTLTRFLRVLGANSICSPSARVSRGR